MKYLMKIFSSVLTYGLSVIYLNKSPIDYGVSLLISLGVNILTAELDNIIENEKIRKSEASLHTGVKVSKSVKSDEEDEEDDEYWSKFLREYIKYKSMK